MAEEKAPLSKQELNDQMLVRREKLQDLKSKGDDPFEIVTYDVTDAIEEIVNNFSDYEEETVQVAGRLIGKRGMGKSGFGDLLGQNAKIQLFVKIDNLGEDAYNEWKKLDLGDVIGVNGQVIKTRTGEVSIRVMSYTLLAKCVRPLPEKFHGLQDQDTRYRQRYLDLIVNPDVRDSFIKRSRIISTIRRILDEKAFIEVETPILNQIPGGANARPFRTHHNTLDLDMYLRIAPELYLKRLVVGGLERVYELGRNFRNEGMDTRHNPEFTMIELYQAYTDYKGMM